MKVCVVIPAFKVANHILDVIERIPASIDTIYVIDDCCPEKSGQIVTENCKDSRVSVVTHSKNMGVGGALRTGYLHALEDGVDVCIKVDGDGQMNPALIPKFLKPILEQRADYTKGNRFHRIESLESMPFVRKFGNACLSLINKFTSGYWNVMDPTNGFTAIHRTALESLPLDKINDRYFFESDMLFRLGTIRAVVKDIPMDAVYGDENSSLQIGRTITEFLPLYFKAFWKRLFYTYFLRDFNAASMETVLGSMLFVFGFAFGAYSWSTSSANLEFASTGTVMLSVVPLIMGFQLLLSALHFDIENIPKEPLIANSTDPL
jgi:dolichol-phosphate mannosyltransferase